MLHSTYSYSIIFSCRTFIRLFDISFKKTLDRKSTRLNSSHANISYAVFCLKKKKQNEIVKEGGMEVGLQVEGLLHDRIVQHMMKNDAAESATHTVVAVQERSDGPQNVAARL